MGAIKLIYGLDLFGAATMLKIPIRHHDRVHEVTLHSLGHVERALLRRRLRDYLVSAEAAELPVSKVRPATATA